MHQQSEQLLAFEDSTTRQFNQTDEVFEQVRKQTNRSLNGEQEMGKKIVGT